MTDRNKANELSEAELDEVQGGLLLPAVQAAREAARDSIGYLQDAVATESFSASEGDAAGVEIPNLKITFSSAD